eukprot:s2640_g12.t3
MVMPPHSHEKNAAVSRDVRKTREKELLLGHGIQIYRSTHIVGPWRSMIKSSSCIGFPRRFVFQGLPKVQLRQTLFAFRGLLALPQLSGSEDAQNQCHQRAEGTSWAFPPPLLASASHTASGATASW